MPFLIMAGQRAWRNDAKGGETEEIHSPFIQDYIERRERQRELRAWTTAGDDGASGSWARTMTWGKRGVPIASVEVRHQDATSDGGDGFYYAVNFGAVGGLFHQNGAGEERRLFHRERFACEGLSFQPATRRFAAAFGGDGATHIVLLDENGKQIRWLTEGDCHDAYPAWDPVRPDVVLYQTSGMARRSDGWAEHGTWEAMELDVEKGTLASLWRREDTDVLLPRRDSQGRLYALIRPSGSSPVPWWEYARQAALVPWIFAQAMFGFASAFTSMFARKPLWKAGGSAERVEAAPPIRILGKQLETRALQDRNRRNAAERPSLAPESWQLWRRDPDGGERKIATHVSWYALGADDTPYYSTGLAIHAYREGKEDTVYEGALVESFIPLQ